LGRNHKNKSKNPKKYRQGKSKSSYGISRGRINYLRDHELKEENANYIFEGLCSSALEMLHALITLDGYKVKRYSHLGYYLTDVIKNRELSSYFSYCIKKRNSLIFYGEKMSFETAKEAIKTCIKLIRGLQKLLEDSLNSENTEQQQKDIDNINTSTNKT
jgi:hypothetical protein